MTGNRAEVDLNPHKILLVSTRHEYSAQVVTPVIFAPFPRCELIEQETIRSLYSDPVCLNPTSLGPLAVSGMQQEAPGSGPDGMFAL